MSSGVPAKKTSQSHMNLFSAAFKKIILLHMAIYQSSQFISVIHVDQFRDIRIDHDAIQNGPGQKHNDAQKAIIKTTQE